MPDFDSVIIRMRWSEAARYAISAGAIFGIIPLWIGRDGFVFSFVSFAALGWTFGLFVLKRQPVSSAGRDGLRLGSVRVLWEHIHSPILDGERIRITNSSGVHLHIPPGAWRDSKYRKFVETNAPAGHELVALLQMHAPERGA